MTLDGWGKKAAGLVLNHSVAEGRLTKEREALKEAKAEAEATRQALELLQSVAQAVQQSAHARITSIVTACLKAVFDDPYTFHIDFERRRGKTEADLYFMKGGERFERPWRVGGGTLDVASFALRIACLVLTKPALRRVIIADEPFKNVNGRENRRRVREMMETLPKELGVQVIMSTGYEWLEIGSVEEM